MPRTSKIVNAVKKVFRKRNVYRKKNMRMRRKMQVKNAKKLNVGADVHYFKRSTTELRQGTVAQVPYTKTWILNNLTQISDFTNLFAQYRIDKIQIKATYTDSTDTDKTVRMFYYKNRTGENITSDADLRRKTQCRYLQLKPNTTKSIWIKPNTLIDALIVGGADSSYGNPKYNDYYNIQDININYNGLTMWFGNFSSADQQVELEYIFYLSFKQSA